MSVLTKFMLKILRLFNYHTISKNSTTEPTSQELNNYHLYVEMKLFQNRAIGAILFSGFISGLYRFPVWTLMTLYFLKYSNLSYIDIGMIFTVQGLIPVAITPFVGKFSDNNGRKKSLLFGLWLSELSFLIMIMSVIFNINTFVIIIAFMGEGIATSLTRTLNRAMLTDLISGSTHISVFGNQRVFTNAGIGVGMIVAGLAFEAGPFLFFLLPVIGILCVIYIVSSFVPETRHTVKTEKNNEIRLKINSNTLLFFIILSLSSLVAIMFFTPMFPLFFKVVDGFTPLQISLFLSINTAVVVTLQIPINKLAERIGEVVTISIGLLLYGICYFLIDQLHNFNTIALIVVIMGVGENMVLPMITVIMSKLAPENSRGLYMGVYSSISGIIIPLGSIAGTSMLQYFTIHSSSTWEVLFLFSITMAIILPFYTRSHTRRESKKNIV